MRIIWQFSEKKYGVQCECGEQFIGKADDLACCPHCMHAEWIDTMLPQWHQIQALIEKACSGS